jgi:hypothetical protein
LAISASVSVSVASLSLSITADPSIAEIAKGLSHPPTGVKTALEHLTQTHAFGLQEDGELWRARPFSAVPTAFPDCTGEQPGASNQLILCANFTAS